MSKAVALEELASPVADHVVIVPGAVRTAKSLRPVHGLDRFVAPRFGTRVAKEFRNLHSVLELNLVKAMAFTTL